MRNRKTFIQRIKDNKIYIILVIFIVYTISIIYYNDYSYNNKLEKVKQEKEIYLEELKILKEPLEKLNELDKKRDAIEISIQENKINLAKEIEKLEQLKNDTENKNAELYFEKGEVETKIRCYRTKAHSELDCEDEEMLKQFIK